MDKNYLYWRIILKELNDFSSRVEFLQSAIRDKVIDISHIDVSKYLESLKCIVNEHENSLFRNSNKNIGEGHTLPKLISIKRDSIKANHENNVLF